MQLAKNKMGKTAAVMIVVLMLFISAIVTPQARPLGCRLQEIIRRFSHLILESVVVSATHIQQPLPGDPKASAL
jgi:hypothetical protein